ncbi:MAG: HlyD family secretion protein [Gammaproteobacteria bacterium]|nr:HlyD family secretion protein [Gammaproteobacteria bacterium]
MNRLSRLVQSILQQRALVVFFLALALYGGYVFWRHLQNYVSTDDAYVGAHVVPVAAQVSGPVAHLYVRDNSPVRQGQRLFEIDLHPFQIAVAAAKALVAERKAALVNAQFISERTTKMAARRFLSSQASQTAETAVQTDRAAWQAAQAALAQARLNLRHCLVRAATTGYISDMNIRTGTFIQEGTPLFALISSERYWVTANFKETELAHIHPGEKAHIHVDMYPGHLFRGRVESISGGSGTAFSLLPPENATGNWVKVTQRVPVRIVILNVSPKWPLRIGTSATATVYFPGH